MLKEVNGEYIKEKYNIYDDKKVGDLIREERIKWYNKKIQKNMLKNTNI